ncbi:hypothetical protein J2W25_002631 [Variovorax boronicumulans]|uniref:Restriction endonuclease domain-containing protein n=1 Tax=Variovorax boronicumulans TaxID=436515 RepID=A0AAW8DVN7_9BURK|nr:hypothetical protein [Variovorax boronicumulans]MDP9878388.1 hypothetical protein [Variovorax boronicumulans]MDP9916113.1 hypothetical protein [Variovorax boronicumulans]MDP9923608.1 hypothetical protein [Variovorax boronicumulans]
MSALAATAAFALADEVVATPIGPPPPAPDVPMPPPPPPVLPPEGDPPPVVPPVTDPDFPSPVSDPPPLQAAVPFGKPHARRLREIYRSAGWPCCDTIEVELLAGGFLERVRSALGHETLRVTDAGIARIASTLTVNRAALSPHEALVERVAREMTRGGRIAWRGLGLRARLPPLEEGGKPRWCMARPDVFSIRNTSVEAYAHPIVHEVKVSRADLLGDLRKPDKRAAYLDLGGECWYVLGNDAKGRCIASPDEIPAECGVMVLEGERLVVARAAVHRAFERIPFSVWLALAKAQPVAGFEDDAQDLLI